MTKAVQRSAVSDQPSAKRRWLVGAIAALALAQTLAYSVYLRGDPGNYNAAGAQGDQVAYIELAQQILHGTWQGAVHYMPGLPAVIALSQLLVGDPRLGIALVQGVVYAALVLLAARLAAEAFGEGSQVWAAAAAGLNPALGYYAAQALTEFLAAAVLLALAGTLFAWGRQPRMRWLALAGGLIGMAGYLRSEYLGLAAVFALIVFWLGRGRPAQALLHAGVLIAVTAVVVAPWVARYAVATGRPALYNEGPFSNLLLMGTWFRVFDEQTFSELQRIETAPGPREEAIQRAASVGPRPELSRRYMEQARGPYDRPLPETLGLVAGNIQLNLRQYLVNHFVLAPVLIWAGHTPVRQGDAPSLPAPARYAIWGTELLLLALAVWQALVMLTQPTNRGELPPLREARPPLARLHSPSVFDKDNANRQRSADAPADVPRDGELAALALSFVGIVVFLTAIHVIIAVDERFTTPALGLIGVFAGARAARLVRARQHVAVGYAG